MGSSLEEMWENYKDIIFEGIKRYAPKKILTKNPDPEYYNKEVKRLKVIVRKMYNKRIFGQPYQAELKRLSKELLVAKEKAQEIFLRSVLHNEGRCWTEFCEYVKRRKGNRESIPAIKDYNGKLIADPIEMSNSLNSYYASVFSYESNNLQIDSTQSCKPFTISINIIRVKDFYDTRRESRRATI